MGLRGLQRGASLYRSRAAPGEPVSNVLLYGTGEQAMLALRALRDAGDSGRVLVGFVDPDPLKQDRVVQGLPVFGGTGACADLCREHDIDEIIVAVGDAAADREQEVARQCAEVGVACRSFDVQINPLGAEHEDPDPNEPVPGPPA
jgi:UDP-GlcNAc:undecaprenyl-phosphate GlcNAc-1-phosphate transferase